MSDKKYFVFYRFCSIINRKILLYVKINISCIKYDVLCLVYIVYKYSNDMQDIAKQISDQWGTDFNLVLKVKIFKYIFIHI